MSDHLIALQALEALGYAVVIYSPEELAGVSPKVLEDYLIEQGNEYIELQEECVCPYAMT